MEQLFLKTYVSDANTLNIKFNTGISFFEKLGRIYVLANTNITSCINEELKRLIYKKIYSLGKPIVYISMFENKKDFGESVESIAWGTYVWFEDHPNHYIHFDESPSKLAINKT